MTQPLLDDHDAPPNLSTDARRLLADDNSAFRDELVASEAALTAVQIAEPVELISDWERDGLIFAVPYHGESVFFTFQFRDGTPHPTIKQVLAALPAHFSSWQRAAWFASTNGWLDDKAPRDCLDEPQLVVSAARREAEDVIG